MTEPRPDAVRVAEPAPQQAAPTEIDRYSGVALGVECAWPAMQSARDFPASQSS